MAFFIDYCNFSMSLKVAVFEKLPIGYGSSGSGSNLSKTGAMSSGSSWK